MPVMRTCRKLVLLLAALALILASCEKDPVPVDPGKSLKDITVPAGFNFELVQSVPVRVQLPDFIDYTSVNRVVEVWIDSPDGKSLILVKTGTAGNDGVYTGAVRLPSSTRKIYTNCYAGWRYTGIPADLLKTGSGELTIDYNPGFGKTPPKPRSGVLAGPSGGCNLPETMKKSGYENKVVNGDFSDTRFKTMEAWYGQMEIDGTWHATDEAGRYASVIAEEGNTFARISSTQYTAGGFTQLVEAAAGQIVTFSGDARGFDSQQDIYLYLVPRDLNGEYIDLFSYNILNPGIKWTNGTVVGTMPEGTVSCQILFFKGATGLVDFDNAVVRVNDPVSDADGDGVLDWEDNYPADAAKAFNDHFPGKGKPGSYVFEDSWPQHGDFDFNDLVVDYEITRVTNSANRVVEIDLSASVRAIGSQKRMGFGIQLNLPSGAIASFTGDPASPVENIEFDANGTERNQQKATFILFTDASQLITRVQEGSPTVNTTMGFHFIVPSVRKFKIRLAEPVDPETVHPSTFNAFIFSTGDRSHETHLKGFPPTDLAAPRLFGTADDASALAEGRYYESTKGLTWGLNVPVQFEYPIENKDITSGLLFFTNWISSSGHDYKEWYLDRQGYRNWDQIYRW